MTPEFIKSLNKHSSDLERMIVDLAVVFYNERDYTPTDIQDMFSYSFTVVKNEVSLLRRFLFSAIIDYSDLSYSDKTNFLDCFQIVDSIEDNLNDAWNQTDTSILISCLSMATTLGVIFDEKRNDF